MSNAETLHPCQKCGACCASYRVSFYWLEAEPDVENAVPIEWTEEVNLRFRCMKGTNKKHHPHCAALSGRVGQKVGCEIYSNRPSPCRNFKASFEDGYHQPRCDEARAKHGLKPLTKYDWPAADTNPSVDL